MTLPKIFSFSATALVIAMGIGGCGGGGAGSGTVACPASSGALCPFITTGGTTVGGSTSPVALFTTAPSAITLLSASTASYTVSGGTAPYTATSGNTAVVSTAVNGTSFTLTSTASGGPVPIAIVDSTGKTLSVNVTVVAKGQGVAPSLFPSAINAGDCTTNIPFIFTGGTAPFTLLTSSVFGVPISSPLPLPLGPDSYFLASIDASKISAPFPYVATLTVIDSQSRTSFAKVTIDFPRAGGCPVNALLQVEPNSVNVRSTNIVTFQIIGGPPFTTLDASRFSVTSSNPAVATPAAVVIEAANKASFNVTANGGGTTLVTVTLDGQKASTVFTTLPPGP